jgi:hypothetical protein
MSLDLLALGHGSEADTAHVAGCEVCRQHVARSQPTREPLPAWAHPRPWWSRWAPGGVGLVLAAAVALVLLRAPGEPPLEPQTRAKGQPSFALYVEDGGRVHLWNGVEALPPGARLQAKVNGAGFTRVLVGVETTAGWSTLYEGALAAHGETTLPSSWRVDDHDPALKLGFLLCDGPCAAGELAAEARAATRDGHRWWAPFSMRVGGRP